jgi:hypothetical protein
MEALRSTSLAFGVPPSLSWAQIKSLGEIKVSAGSMVC